MTSRIRRRSHGGEINGALARGDRSEAGERRDKKAAAIEARERRPLRDGGTSRRLLLISEWIAPISPLY
jgi:hypothetical protein